jgi:hypothetical protein
MPVSDCRSARCSRIHQLSLRLGSGTFCALCARSSTTRRSFHAALSQTLPRTAHPTDDAVIGYQLWNYSLGTGCHGRNVQQRIGFAPSPDRHHQGIRDEVRCHCSPHRPADNALRMSFRCFSRKEVPSPEIRRSTISSDGQQSEVVPGLLNSDGYRRSDSGGRNLIGDGVLPSLQHKILALGKCTHIILFWSGPVRHDSPELGGSCAEDFPGPTALFTVRLLCCTAGANRNCRS